MMLRVFVCRKSRNPNSKQIFSIAKVAIRYIFSIEMSGYLHKEEKCIAL